MFFRSWIDSFIQMNKWALEIYKHDKWAEKAIKKKIPSFKIDTNNLKYLPVTITKKVKTCVTLRTLSLLDKI